MKIENIPAEIKSKSLKEAREEINEILVKLESDNYDLKSSHFLPALIRKIVEAIRTNKNYITLWGNGKPLREFLHVDDFARAIILASKKYNQSEPLNVGSGMEISILKTSSKNLEKITP